MQMASQHQQPWLVPVCPLAHAPYSWNLKPSTVCWEINCLGPGGIAKASSTKDLCISVQRCISFPTARGSHLDLADVILFVQAERSLYFCQRYFPYLKCHPKQVAKVTHLLSTCLLPFSMSEKVFYVLGMLIKFENWSLKKTLEGSEAPF